MRNGLCMVIERVFVRIECRVVAISESAAGGRIMSERTEYVKQISRPPVTPSRKLTHSPLRTLILYVRRDTQGRAAKGTMRSAHPSKTIDFFQATMPCHIEHKERSSRLRNATIARPAVCTTCTQLNFTCHLGSAEWTLYIFVQCGDFTSGLNMCTFSDTAHDISTMTVTTRDVST